MLFAIKTISKKKLDVNTKAKELLNTEIRIMFKIKHPNIMHLYQYLESKKNHYLVLQFCNNGDLEEYVEKKKYLQEGEAIYFLK